MIFEFDSVEDLFPDFDGQLCGLRSTDTEHREGKAECDPDTSDVRMDWGGARSGIEVASKGDLAM